MLSRAQPVRQIGEVTSQIGLGLQHVGVTYMSPQSAPRESTNSLAKVVDNSSSFRRIVVPSQLSQVRGQD